MKFIKFTAIIALIFMMNSCKQELFRAPYSEILIVKERDWKLVGVLGELGSYYEYVFTGLPPEAYNGVITAYMYLNYNKGSELQTPLPYTIYEYDSSADAYYSVLYTYDIADDGSIAFKAYVSDYYTNWFNPGTQTFRVAIVW